MGSEAARSSQPSSISNKLTVAMDQERTRQLLDAFPEDDDSDLENFRRILAQGQDQDGMNSDSRITLLLFQAARRDCSRACRLVCERGFSERLKKQFSTTITYSKYSPLHMAAYLGHVKVLRVLKEHGFNLNQHDMRLRPPLFYSKSHPETCSFLVENGADPNEGGLYQSVLDGNVNATRVLLENGADPKNIGNDEKWNDPITDVAIRNGYAEILSLLIQYGALVGNFEEEWQEWRTSLNDLIWTSRHTREEKIYICRILVNHAKTKGAHFLNCSLKNGIENCELFLEAGMEPGYIDRAIKDGKKSVCRLLVNNGVDPFEFHDLGEHVDLHYSIDSAQSPLHYVARKTRRKHLRILEYFLKVWQERFASSNAVRSGDGKHSNGDYLIHFLCRDKHVSLKAIKFVVENYGQVNKLMLTNDTDGFRPLLVAAKSDASLDVIFYLLKHHPIAAIGQALETKASAA